jgi:hypothetical protein
MGQTLEKVLIFHTILACHFQIDAYLDPVPDPAYHFDADPNPDFYLMRIRIRMLIQVTKMIRIQIHTTGKQSCLGASFVSY